MFKVATFFLPSAAEEQLHQSLALQQDIEPQSAGFLSSLRIHAELNANWGPGHPARPGPRRILEGSQVIVDLYADIPGTDKKMECARIQ